MGKFTLECPNCNSLNTTPNIFQFWKREINCGTCGNEINIKKARMISKRCPNVKCGKVIVCDQKKLKGKKCPSCGTLLENSFTYEMIGVICPQCTCQIDINKNEVNDTCPVCDLKINVKEIVTKSRQVTDTGISVIKYEGDNDTFVWKHPIEDFNYGSQLIVHESQEAIFFLNGQALDLFGSGRYSLDTEILPVLKKVQELPTGKQNPFHAEIYFINKTVQMSLLWGTDEKIRFIEPRTGAPIEIGASGELNLQVSDARKLLIKLVGTTSGITWDNEDKENFTHSLKKSFKPIIQTIVKANLALIIKRENIDILEIDENLEVISKFLREKISEGFLEYGLCIPQFYVTNILLPDENDSNFRIIKKLHTEKLRSIDEEFEANMIAARRRQVLEKQLTGIEQAKYEADKKRIEAQAEADKLLIEGEADIRLQRTRGFVEAEIMEAKGYNQKDIIQADVQKAYAEGIGNMGGNGGSGSFMSDILGLSIGMAAMGTMNEKVNEAVNGFSVSSQMNTDLKNIDIVSDKWKCVCNYVNMGNFCSECGRPKPETWECPHCGNKANIGKFCIQCGQVKQENWECSNCGAKGNKGKFCFECGTKRGE